LATRQRTANSSIDRAATPSTTNGMEGAGPVGSGVD